jgi:hypothetical protein
MTNWHAPAKLVFWPAEAASEQIYPTLVEALEQAERGADRGTPWIVTEDGHIISSHEMAMLRARMAARKRTRRLLSCLRGRRDQRQA